MPRHSVDTLNEQIEEAALMRPSDDSDLRTVTVLHALQTTSEGIKRLADHQDRQSLQITSVSDVVHSMDKRLAIMEANSLLTRVEKHGERLDALEDKEQRRAGAVNAAEWGLKHWPGVVGFIALIMTVLIATGKVNP